MLQDHQMNDLAGISKNVSQLFFETPSISTYRVLHIFPDTMFPVLKLFLIVLGTSDERMLYWLDLGDYFDVLYIVVTYLVQELYQKTWKL